MALDFQPLPRVYEDMPLWGARTLLWTFVISFDNEDLYRASAKGVTGEPFDGQRIDLGDAHRSLEDAKRACQQFYERWQ